MIVRRIANSTAFWSWVYNAFRLASGLVILPLVFRQLSISELGMYYVLLNLAALAPLIDFGFGPTFGRFIGYAMGGAQTLEAQGVPKPTASNGPNYTLLWRLLETTRRLYRYLALALFLLLGTGGTLQVEHLISVQAATDPAFSPGLARLAWLATLLSTVLDVYANWWSIYLRGLNEVKVAAQIGVLAAVIKCGIASGLLLAGGGLLSLPLAGLACNILQRQLARARCLKLLPPRPKSAVDLKAEFRMLWPSSWRLGLQVLTGSLVTQANTFICANVFHLDATAKYGPSVQLMGIASSMAYVWVMVKWPLVSQYRARHDCLAIQRLFWPRFWLQTVSFLILGGLVVFCAPAVLHWIGKDKELLPLNWMLVLMAGVFCDLQFTTWGTLITTENRFPFLWPTVLTNIGSLVLSLTLVHYTSLGLGALVLGPVLAGCLFNYWYWPQVAARGMNTTLWRFLFLGPTKPGLGFAETNPKHA